MSWRLLNLLLITVLLKISVTFAENESSSWWKNAVFYQIYPRSFKDSNDDGIGDLKGITSKLDHFKDAGVTAAWLSPIYKSPQKDAGYDISDYRDIHFEYGTLADFDEMVKEAHKRGIKIIMDFVPNHSSDQHEWFGKSEKNETEYKDYYVWANANTSTGGVPCNWLSIFRGSTWTWSDVRQQYYLHQFSKEQPELNFRNPKVMQEMKDILTFWLDKGVDGFRIDAVPFIIEDERYLDEPLSGNTNDDEDYGYLKHIYTFDQDGTFDVVYEWRKFMDQYSKEHGGDERVLLTEGYTDIDHTMLYYGTPDGSTLGAHVSFNFFFITDLWRTPDAKKTVEVVQKWMGHMPSIYTPNWVLGNHDNYRVATRMRPENADGYNMLVGMLPGVAVTYNGEEIGQENGEVKFEECQDQTACFNETIFENNSRDFERTPFHWDNTTNAGFSGASKTWLPVSEKYLQTNLYYQKVEGQRSHYQVYRDLIKLRKENVLKYGKLDITLMSDTVVALTRKLSDKNQFLFVFNVGDNSKTINLTKQFDLNSKQGKVLLTSVKSSRNVNEIIKIDELSLDSHECIIASVVVPMGSSDWWKSAVFYQIYPRSFKDSNNDGIGDIKGIISKLDHFKDSGIKAAWLSPIYASPQKDAGYDISDYKDIHHEYGTLEDFDLLIEEAHKRGVKIVMDFVPNHSSEQHEWFSKSEQKVSGYEDYYVWANKNETTGDVPNNWVSIFRGSAWTWSDIRKQYYFHQFAKEQPDLNFRNPKVHDEMKGVLKFWLDRGVDGFRIDAVPFLFEDDKYLDEPLSGVNNDPDDYGYLKHIYTYDQDGTFDLIYQWREFIDQYSIEHGGDARVLLTESYTDINKTMLYYGTSDGTRLGSHVSFNFFLITDLRGVVEANKTVAIVKKWMDNMPSIYTANWVLGNHDQYRVATRFKPENIDGFNMLVAVLPGIAITYNGEEIGQENGEVKFEECQDQTACFNETIFEMMSRDFERTPFHWDNTTNAGFNEGHKPWLPVSKKYLETNLHYQKADGLKSHYHVYQELIKLRNEDVLKRGALQIMTISDTVLALTRKISEIKQYLFVFNIGDQVKTVNLTKEFNLAYKRANVLVANIQSQRNKRDILSTNSITLQPHESILAEVEPVNVDWWKNAVFYQIYPRSFKDSNNDGIGDLQGIVSKLDHLKETGVSAAWLSPIYKSPQKDQGYDISDYRDIHGEYGTLADFDDLVKEAHKRGIKVVMDFVPNHSSDEHEWFIKSQNNVSGYENYYVWANENSTNVNRLPNNWISRFGKTAWEWSDIRKQYYLHQFKKEQPDLNYRSEEIRREMKDVMKFWLDRGVDGFRIDAVPFFFEDDKLFDEPQSGLTSDPDDWHHLKHIHTHDQDSTYDLIYEWREFIDQYSKAHGGDERVLLTEAYTDINKTMLYYGTADGKRKGAHVSFNFYLITDLLKNVNAKATVDAVKKWMDNMPKVYTANWVLGNHDNHRAATRYKPENVDGYNMLLALLPGVVITYNGEEIGQENGEVAFEQCQDQMSCTNETIFEQEGRDFERTPFHWDNTTNAGFNEGQKPWLPVSEKYLETNLYYQKAEGAHSHYHIYKELIKLKENEVIKTGTLNITTYADTVLTLSRKLENHSEYLLVFNIGEQQKSVDVTTFVSHRSLQVLINNVNSEFVVGRNYCLDALSLKPHESVVGIVVDEKCESEKGGGNSIKMTFSVVCILALLVLFN